MQGHNGKRFKLLLVAYDFPPIPSPQSLRWTYLAAELQRVGVEVHVLAPDIAGYGSGGLPELPESVTIHRVWPGPVAAWRTYRKRRVSKRALPTSGRGGSIGGDAAHMLISPASTQLNWKGMIRESVLRRIRACTRVFSSWLGGESGNLLDAVGARLFFPDLRAEWMPWARRRLDTLLRTLQPDVVVTSHEPANSIPLGIRASKQGFCWVSDLGDPILASYTPSHWKKRATMLEREVCTRADLITLTSKSARTILEQRYPELAFRSCVLTQGFDHRYNSDAGEQACDELFDPGLLELLYTGSFYSFRSAASLIEAIVRAEDVRLSVASISPSPDILRAAATYPDKFRLLGFVPHRQVLSLQRGCDVLVNLANADPVQVPGKLYEYLGTGVSILHVGDRQDDVAADVVRKHHLGWVIENNADRLTELLAVLLKKKVGGGLLHGTPSEEVQEYAWANIAKQLLEQLRDVSARQPGTGRAAQIRRN